MQTLQMQYMEEMFGGEGKGTTDQCCIALLMGKRLDMPNEKDGQIQKKIGCCGIE